MEHNIRKNDLKPSPLHHDARIVLKSCKRIVGAFGKCAAFALFAVGLGAIASAAQVVLEFDYPANELPGMTFRAYSTNDVNAPIITWPLLATFVGTNRVLVTLPQGINFAVVNASNALGSSFFSAAAAGILPRTNVVPRFVKP